MEPWKLVLRRPRGLNLMFNLNFIKHKEIKYKLSTTS